MAIEKAEIDKAITLESLERAAHALDCQLVYALIPRQTLEQSVKDRALARARQRLAHTAHSMALEDQAVEDAAQEEHVRALAARLLAAPGSRLWDEG